MSVSLDQVEAGLAKLWNEQARTAGGSRAALMTLVALVSDPALLERAQRVVSQVVQTHPARTIVAVWRDGKDASLTADIALHTPAGGGSVCGDAITLEAVGAAREWIPGNTERLALADLPVCVWWVGDLPDFDDLFDRMVVGADVVVVNSGEMDLRDLEKLSSIATRAEGRFAIADLTWIRLRTVQDCVARFFDDAEGMAFLPKLERIVIETAPRPDEKDATSTQAGLLFGWIATALGLSPDGAQWKRGAGWNEVKLGTLTARFEAKARTDVRPGVITRIAFEAGPARFALDRLDDPRTYRWSREVPGVGCPTQTLRVGAFEEPALLGRCLERPKRDLLLETSLRTGSRIVRPVAPRLSVAPPPR